MPESTSPTRIRFRVLRWLSILAMITYLDRVCFGAAAPMIASELGLNGVEDLKWAFTAFSLAYAIFEIPIGWMGDRLGPRSTLIRIVACWSICTALTGAVGIRIGEFVMGGLGTMIVLRFLFGAGEAGAFPNIARAIHNWFPPTEWPRAQGVIWMSSRIMGGLTPLIWAILVTGTAYSPSLLSWRGAFYFFGALGLLWCLLFAWQFRNSPREDPRCNEAERELTHDATSLSHSPHRVPWKAMLRNPTLWALCVMYFCITYGWYFNVTYLPGYLKERYAVDDRSVLGAIYKGGPLWVGAAGCLSGGYLVGWFARRLGDAGKGRRALGLSALSVCALCWLLAIPAPNEHLFFVAISMAAFCNDLILGSAWATCQDIGQRHAGVTAATMNTIGAVGSAVAAWLTGTIVQHASQADPSLQAKLTGYDQVFVSYALVYLIAAMCWMFIRSERRFEPEAI